jgi:hypothetical protein
MLLCSLDVRVLESVFTESWTGSSLLLNMDPIRIQIPDPDQDLL